MSLRQEFVQLAAQDAANFALLCRRFGISRKTGYKWLGRFQEEGAGGLADQSRRPRSCPRQTPDALEQRILEVRDAHPCWGGRKIHAWLRRRGVAGLPAASTITAILRRHGRLDPRPSAAHRPVRRFAYDAPNRLWQMDFKGHFGLQVGRCHPLTVLDDHSRFALGLFACADEQTATVQGHLTTVFRRYGLPERILCDNGPPWGAGPEAEHTPLTVWLLRLGIGVLHGRPYHPQTQGKDERFHRTLKAELLQGPPPRDLEASQERFDRWRPVYNWERPHEALALDVPGERYQVSVRPYPEQLPELVYEPPTVVRKVHRHGRIRFQGRDWQIGKAFVGHPVGVRPTRVAGVWEVVLGSVCIKVLDERPPAS
jgi:transposase InsO family protein